MARKQTLMISFFFSLCLLVLVSCTGTTPDEDAEIMNMYEEWMVEHNRVYNGPGEKQHRFEIFKNNVKLVNDHNKVEGRMFDLAVNEFADLTSEEFKASYTGYRSKPMAQPQPRATVSNLDIHDVPDSIDWREKGAVGRVKYQGTCGSCWAFSAVAAIEGITQIKTGKLLDLSEQELVDCDTYNFGCRDGQVNNTFNWIVHNKGLNSEDSYPYVGKENKCQKEKSSVSVANITGFEYVPSNNETALQAAVSRQPVVAYIEASSPQFRFYHSGIFDGRGCSTNLDHGVTVVGYGALADGTQYWIVKNSWGRNWGEDGYGRLLKGVKTTGVCGMAMVGMYPLKE